MTPRATYTAHSSCVPTERSSDGQADAPARVGDDRRLAGGAKVQVHNHADGARRYIFFFQAEDGIRDVAVTGVQTCALPISPDRRCRWRAEPERCSPGTCATPTSTIRRTSARSRTWSGSLTSRWAGRSRRGIGRASGRGRGEISGGGGSFKKKKREEREESRC